MTSFATAESAGLQQHDQIVEDEADSPRDSLDSAASLIALEDGNGQASLSARRDYDEAGGLPYNNSRWLTARSARVERVYAWVYGPESPRRASIKPFFPEVQLAPRKWLAKHATFLNDDFRAASMISLVWLFCFTSILAASWRRGSEPVDGQAPVRLTCSTTLWPNATYCGIEGEQCKPFADASFPFVCPSDCASMQVLEPYYVGNQEINYQSFVIGGTEDVSGQKPIYRGDSFICPAALHAGIISSAFGGSGILIREGSHSEFASTTSNRLRSISSNTTFPLSFSLRSSSTKIFDPRWLLLTLTAVSTVLITLFTATPLHFFISTSLMAFMQTALASDPPLTSPPDLISLTFRRLLPTALTCIPIYTYITHRTFQNLSAPLETSLLYLLGLWLGALNSQTFDRIPISRLTPHDLQQQPGAIPALFIILAVLHLAFLGQIYTLRLEGRLPSFLRFYAFLALLLVVLAFVPGQNLRLHHYIIALLLLPGTATQTRSSLLYQGLLLGLFLNGIARWGWDSILQTDAALVQTGGSTGSALPEVLIENVNGTVIEFAVEVARGWVGVFAVVDDVMRVRDAGMSGGEVWKWVWRRVGPGDVYFRFGFVGSGVLGGTWTGDLSKPGTWYGNGTWSGIG